jgi:glycosyltransferase involved in cell wall biosynthesis
VLAGGHLGAGSLVAPGGIYVAASSKEEFGLAIVEALAAGLPVVAPHIGGPSTYLTDGDTGVLADTTSIPALTAAMYRARSLVDRPGRVERADELIDTRLSVDAMAEALIDVYRSTLVPV